MNDSKDKNDNTKSATGSATLTPEETMLTGVVGIVISAEGNPISGQLVALYAGAAGRGTPLGTAITNKDGSYSIVHTGRETTYSVKVVPPLPPGMSSVTPDPAVVSVKANGFAAAGIFVIH